MTATAPAPGTVLPEMDVALRLPRLRVALAALEDAPDALLVTNLKNIRYLTGFTGSAAMLVLIPDAVLLTTDGRYRTQSAQQLQAAGVAARFAIGKPSEQEEEISLALAAAACTTVGLEATHVTWSQQRRLLDVWDGVHEVVPTSGLVECLRRTKDAGELARVREAARIADAALDQVSHLLGEGVTEIEFGIELDFAMRRLGASGPSFETIVASGPNGAKPHHRPSGRRIERGELITLDFGALVDGYCSDMTRTVCVGFPSDPQYIRMLEVVAESQAAGVAAVRAGVEASTVDRACRAVIEDAGWGEQFVHGTGHGVGLDIHESPAVSATSCDVLTTGSVVTVEPGVYLPGIGGVRIEDCVVVTDTGCDPLTRFPKDWIL